MKYNIKERERDREEPGKCLRDRKMATWVRLGLAGLVGLLRKMGCLLVGLSSRGSQITPHPPLIFGRGWNIHTKSGFQNFLVVMSYCHVSLFLSVQLCYINHFFCGRNLEFGYMKALKGKQLSRIEIDYYHIKS